MLEKKINTVGKTIDNVKVMIVNEAEKECDIGEIGRVTISGPGVMLGYYRNQYLTEQTIRNHVLFTGDLGYKDIDGDLFVVGRQDNMFISAGKNIYPEEIEDVLMNTGLFRGVLVEQNDDEEIIAYVENESQVFDNKLLLSLCKANLEDYKVPRRIISVSKLDRTDSGKIKRKRGCE